MPPHGFWQVKGHISWLLDPSSEKTAVNKGVERIAMSNGSPWDGHGEFCWPPGGCVGETWLLPGPTVLSSQINSPLPVDEWIKPKFIHLHPLGKHSCWRSPTERRTVLRGKWEDLQGSRGFDPWRLLSRAGVLPFGDGGGWWNRGRGKEGAERVLAAAAKHFFVFLFTSLWRPMESNVFPNIS